MAGISFDDISSIVNWFPMPGQGSYALHYELTTTEKVEFVILALALVSMALRRCIHC